MNVKDAKVTELSCSLATLDQARDKLVAEANRKDETIVALRRKVEETNVALAKEKLGMATLETELRQTGERSRETERATSKQEASLAETRRQLQQSREQAASFSTQMRILRDDLATMTQVSIT